MCSLSLSFTACVTFIVKNNVQEKLQIFPLNLEFHFSLRPFKNYKLSKMKSS